MSRISSAFASAHGAGRITFIPYLTAGDPSPERSPDLILALQRGGADLVEIGVPFSDPIADGEVNQRAAERALAKGVSLSTALDIAAQVRRVSSIPIVLFTYFNPVLRMGLAPFCERAAGAGVDGVLVTDLPVEEAAEHRRALDAAGIDTIFLLAPTSTPERIRAVGEACRGFVYYVSRTGVTGEREAVPGDLRERVEGIRRMTNKPVAVGFGISRREHVEELSSFADGVVVGSALVRLIEEAGDRPDLPQILERQVRELLPAPGAKRTRTLPPP